MSVLGREVAVRLTVRGSEGTVCGCFPILGKQLASSVKPVHTRRSVLAIKRAGVQEAYLGLCTKGATSVGMSDSTDLPFWDHGCRDLGLVTTSGGSLCLVLGPLFPCRDSGELSRALP